MPRINDRWFSSVIYIYPTEESAKSGDGVGGSGFLLGQKSLNGDHIHIYAVTNRHVVVEHGTRKERFIRTIACDGRTVIKQVKPEDWAFHPDGDDIALCHIDLVKEETPTYFYFNKDDLHSKDTCEDIAIGPGDDVFMLGRFFSHDGRQRNSPIVRFGNIAMMPEENVLHNKVPQKLFLVDSRSTSGFSGSPVFVDIPPDSYRPDKNKQYWDFASNSMRERFEKTRVIGINCGHFDTFTPVKNRDGGMVGEVGTDGIGDRVRQNTGIMLVVPSWRIIETMDTEQLKQVFLATDPHAWRLKPHETTLD
jgi:hypothetical protein